jgi:hypothetical protein
MAKQVQVWQAVDGSLHRNERDALVSDAYGEAEHIAASLAAFIVPPYGDSEAIKRDILERADLVIDLAAALLRAREIQRRPLIEET